MQAVGQGIFSRGQKPVKALVTALLLAGGAAGPAAAGELSGSVTAVTDYVFRGVSQSDGDPAIQGGLTWSAANGFYVGGWASTGSFGRDGSVEFDPYIGYATEWHGIKLELSGIYYAFPGADDATGYATDRFEVIGKAGYDLGLVALTGGVGYTPSGQYRSGRDALYLFSDLEVPIPNTRFTAAFHIGYEDFGAGVTKTDWSTGLYTRLWGFDLGLAYVDSNLRHNQQAKARVLFSLAKSF